MPVLVKCASCGLDLSIPDDAADTVTCPQCAKSFHNPATGRTALPVIPLEQEVEQDKKGATFVVLLIVALLLLACFISIYVGDHHGALLGGLALVVFFGIVAAFRMMDATAQDPPQTRRSRREPLDETRLTIHSNPGGALQYESLWNDPNAARTPPILQFLAGLGIWALGVGFTIWTANDATIARIMRSIGLDELTYVMIVIMVLLALIILLAGFLGVRYHWRSFVPGMIMGLVLTCLVPVGIVVVVCGGVRI